MSAWSDWLIACGAATIGVGMRLSHIWTANQSIPNARPLTVRDVVVAMVAAPGLALIGFGLGRYLKLPDESTIAIVGFISFLGPGALISAWEPISKVIGSSFGPKGGA
jgi:hypothetical protein